jgi:hypothetical protein
VCVVGGGFSGHVGMWGMWGMWVYGDLDLGERVQVGRHAPDGFVRVISGMWCVVGLGGTGL